jgi:hypothetical protein
MISATNEMRQPAHSLKKTTNGKVAKLERRKLVDIPDPQATLFGVEIIWSEPPAGGESPRHLSAARITYRPNCAATKNYFTVSPIVVL